MTTINRATGEAVDAFRKMVQAEQKVLSRQEALVQALSNEDVDMEAYTNMTDEIERAVEEGRAVRDAGLADKVVPN
jgi:hypothetical protein